MAQRRPRRQALTEVVRDYVKDYIITNRLKAGDPLPPETHLSQELGISRSSVREAVKSLESLGILEVHHGNGLRVRGFTFAPVHSILSYGVSLDPENIAQLVALRKWLEAAAICDVVEKATTEDIRRLAQLLEQWKELRARGRPSADVDRLFHQTLYRCLDNSLLTQLIDIFWSVFHNIDLPEIVTDTDPDRTLRDHLGILEAIRRRDPTRAQAAMQSHFAGIEKRIRTHIGRTNEGDAGGGAP